MRHARREMVRLYHPQHTTHSTHHTHPHQIVGKLRGRRAERIRLEQAYGSHFQKTMPSTDHEDGRWEEYQASPMARTHTRGTRPTNAREATCGRLRRADHECRRWGVLERLPPPQTGCGLPHPALFFLLMPPPPPFLAIDGADLRL